MPKPTSKQLKKINQLAKTELKEDQVYVFRNIALDTRPVKRIGWFGEYELTFSSKALNKIKKDYQEGVALLVSHDSERLPVGRTFDAEVNIDYVDDEPLETLYIDNYIVTHLEDDDGNKIPIRTEIGGMTTQDIANNIEAGHIFDTSIGFAIKKPLCSICGHDLRDEKCTHLPGLKYDVQVGDKAEKQTCNIVVDDAEGTENSLVYSGAVDRATILSSNHEENFKKSVNNHTLTLYNVDDIKNVPIHSTVFCRLSKNGGLQMYTYSLKNTVQTNNEKGSEKMDKLQEQLQDMVPKAQYDELKAQLDKLSEQNQGFSKELGEKSKTIEQLQEQVKELQVKVLEYEEQIGQLSEKAKLADQFTEDLIQETLKAGVQARGNAFNKERFEKYLRTLSVAEIKEELESFRKEFPGKIEAARVTKEGVEKEPEVSQQLSKQDLRELAAKKAVERYKAEGGDLEKMTKEEYAKLLEKQNQ